MTLPQIITALGNANINVGGREITVGQQSVNIRGIGLMDSGGNSDLTQGWRVGDIENVVLAQVNGVPVQVKDVAKVSVGHVPRLGIAGKDHESDVALAIVVMGRVYHTNDVIPLIKAKIAQMNSDGTLPPGVKLVPYYDRSTLVSVTTHTVLHNLIFGCLLVFFIQWIFLGNLRSAIIVGVNIPFALFFAVIVMVLMGQDANLLSVGAVDFGIIVDSAVILIENIFRNFQSPGEQQSLLHQLAEGRFGADPTRSAGSTHSPLWTDRLRLILASALQVDMAILFSALITVAAFVPFSPCKGSKVRFSARWHGPTAWRYSAPWRRPLPSRRCWLRFCCRSTSRKPRPSSSGLCAGLTYRFCIGRLPTAKQWWRPPLLFWSSSAFC